MRSGLHVSAALRNHCAFLRIPCAAGLRNSVRQPLASEFASLVKRRKRSGRSFVIGDFAHGAATQILGWVLLECFKAEWATERNHLALDVEMAKAFAMSD